MRVTAAERIAMHDWEQFDREHPSPVFTARPAWARAWCEANAGVEPMPMRCEFDDGSSVIVPLLREKSRLRWKIATGMPWNESIVILESDGHIASNERCVAALDHLSSCVVPDSLTVTLWPLCEQGRIDLQASTLVDEVSVIDLQEGADAAIARMDGRTRRMAGQAARRGVTCARAEGEDALGRYAEMLDDSAKRWGRDRPSISEALLKCVLAHARNDAELWFAYCGDRPIAGGVALYGGSENAEMYFWSAAMLAEHAHLRPSNALNVALLRRAAERGARWYNLGSSFGLQGVREFKDRLGAQRVRYGTQSVQSASFRAYAALRAAVHLG